jgi:hypothetical protein
LTSEIRHETSDAEIRHLTNLLNSDDTTTLLLGTRHAPVESVDHLNEAPRMMQRCSH